MTHYIENFSFPYKPNKIGIKIGSTDKLTGLTKLSHFLAGSETIEELVSRATGYILDLLHINYCRIYMLSDDGQFALPGSEPIKDQTLIDLFFGILRQPVQYPSSPEQVLNSQCREALGIKIRDCHWIIPLRVEQNPVGVLALAKSNSTELDAFPKTVYYLVDLITDQISNALHRRKLNEQLTNSSIETVLALSKTLDTRDPYSGEHSKHLAYLSEQLAKRFGFSSHETRELCWAALLHDIGKIGIEDCILHKAGPLTSLEWEVMRTHPEVGAHIVKGLRGLENIASIILAHHERVDGSGYPRRLKGDQIPLGARIIAVVDSYSAMTEGRPYRNARSHHEAIAEIQKYSGTMYDPMVVNHFVHLFEDNGSII